MYLHRGEEGRAYRDDSLPVFVRDKAVASLRGRPAPNPSMPATIAD